MQFRDYVRYDAIGLAELVRSGEVKPEELMATALQAIADVNPRINAVVDSLESRARARLQGANRAAPFFGVPFLFKDSLEVEGTRVTWGCSLAHDNVSTRTHEVARRFDEAGLVTVGRTNMSEMGLVPTTEPSLYGPTHNPWNLAHSPGGSSGGAAAAVAAGIVPAAHAEDGGGSIRIPASACGLFGLKPSRGRNPTEPYDAPDGFIQHGVVSRTVRDSAALLDVIAGARPFDRWHAPAAPTSFRAASERDPGPLRVGFTTRGLMSDAAHPDCRRAVEETAKLLTELGHEVEEANVAIDGQRFAESFAVIWAMSTGFFVRAALEQLVPSVVPVRARRAMAHSRVFLKLAWLSAVAARRPRLEPMTRRLIEINDSYTVADHWMAWTHLNAVGEQLIATLAPYDVLLAPGLCEPPWRTGHFKLQRSDEATAELLLRYAGLNPLSNTTGLPAMSVPSLTNAGGLPIGVQVIGRYGHEHQLFSLAGQMERASPWPGLRALS